MSELSDRVRKAVSVQGILAVALDDAISRGEQHFTLPPSDAELEAWASSLRTSAPHFFPQAPAVPDAEGVPPGVPPSVWKAMAPSSKLTWLREHGHALPVVERRRPPLPLTPEQVAALAALPPAKRLAAYRELQAQQQP